MRRAGLAALVLVVLPMSARAAPEELQVYMDELDAPGEFGLDVHSNFVFTGAGGREYPGAEPSLHRLRVTPEWSLGLAKFLELGLYLPLATYDPLDGAGVRGVKFRLKVIAPHEPSQRWFVGLNWELGAVDHAIDPNPWNSELKGIVGARFGALTLAFNANFDFKVAGPEPAPAELDFDTRLSFAFTKSLAVGAESYNGAGPVRSPGFAHGEEAAFAVLDASLGAWDVNLGVGSGYAGNGDRFMAKVILGVPIDPRSR